MSTSFYWIPSRDEDQLIFTRYAGGLDPQVDETKHLRYVFNDVKNLIDFFSKPLDTIIYDEYGMPHTIYSLRYEIYKQGVILIDGEI